MMCIIDRFEEGIAVCERGDKRLEIPRLLLPESAQEGDVIIQENGIWCIDVKMTEERRAIILDKMKRLGL
ncbi:MAG: DUF3006 domain-containing protein [Oscillospiraceae bacterium]|nr:DUF3006 domain-containing protein [Oscillospiraceae bacterium]